MRINLPKIFNQNDPNWKNKIIGTKGTIGAWGCLLTDAAMLCQYFGKDETPNTLNEKLKTNGGYQEGNLYVWGALTKIYSDIKYQGQTITPDALTIAQMDFIRGRIDAGYPVFLQIDTIPTTAKLDEHWILVVDYDGDDFILADPWDGAVKRITSWGEKPQRMIYAYAYYTGNPIKPSVDPLKECLAQHTELVNKCNKKDEEIKDLKEQVEVYKKADINNRKMLGSQQNEIESLKKDKNTLEKKLELLQAEMTTELAKEKLNANEKIAALEVRMSKDFELKEAEYKKTIEGLEKQVKEKEIVVEKEETRPKSFREWLLKIIELWPKK